MFDLSVRPPKLTLADHREDMAKCPELSDIFSAEELATAMGAAPGDGQPYAGKAQLVAKGTRADSILCVARGLILEKDGDYDTQCPEVEYTHGNVVRLENLTPGHRLLEPTTNVFCHEASAARVIEINAGQLRKLLEDDLAKGGERTRRLWRILA